MSFAMILWGFAWTSAKIVNDYLSYPNLVFIRYLSSFLFLLPILMLNREKIIFPPIKTLRSIFFVSLLYYVYNIAFFWGTDIGNAGSGGVFVTTTNPIVTFIIISMITREINKFQILGILLGGLGGFIILDVFYYGLSVFNSTNIAFMVCSLTWGIITVIITYGQKDYNSVHYILLCYFFTALISCLNVNLNELLDFSRYDLDFIVHFIIVSIGAMAFGTSVYMYSAPRLGPIQTSVFIFTVPFVAAISAFLVLSEQITYQVIIGGTLSIYSVYLVNFKK